jgi:hypothetical protein
MWKLRRVRITLSCPCDGELTLPLFVKKIFTLFWSEIIVAYLIKFCRIWGSRSGRYEAVLSSGIQRRVVRWKSTDVSEEHVAYVFRVEKISQTRKQREAGKKAEPGLFFIREDGSDMFFLNVRWLLTQYTSVYPIVLGFYEIGFLCMYF